MTATIELADGVRHSAERLEAASRAMSGEYGAGGDVLAAALNNLTALYAAQASFSEDHDDIEDLVALALTVADAGMQLRDRAVQLQLVEETEHGYYVRSGPAFAIANDALYACRQRRAHGEAM